MHFEDNPKTTRTATQQQSEEVHNHQIYGILLHGFLKTRYVDIKNYITCVCECMCFFFVSCISCFHALGSNERFYFEWTESRRANTNSYKGVLLPFGKIQVWENWGKRGDTKYSFGFTIRVSCSNLQIEAADTKELVKCLSQKASNTLSKETDATDGKCENTRSLLNLQAGNVYLSHSEGSGVWNELKPTAQQLLSNVNPNQVNAYIGTDTISIRANTYTRTETEKTNRNRITVDDYDWKTLDELARDDNVIPRRYNAELYDNEGYMSDHLEKKRSPFHLDALPDIVDEPESDSELDKPVNISAQAKTSTQKKDNLSIRIILNSKKKKSEDVFHKDNGAHIPKSNETVRVVNVSFIVSVYGFCCSQNNAVSRSFLLTWLFDSRDPSMLAIANQRTCTSAESDVCFGLRYNNLFPTIT
ncbi:hypothetical protein RFI_27068 [Reticulomyxa filosa]|uniref:Uncharacterized protein n=1 Tax=Reticulomyxa filosa TaxID=46433 RepID=X6MBA2_RETFI|nr:hypothetical protein RFI_27068 [Reticulomyxa filosa]|eukprot:ETO10310.1 hypothetical protein RFI_27068 [Reticulomyxa filosa]